MAAVVTWHGIAFSLVSYFNLTDTSSRRGTGSTPAGDAGSVEFRLINTVEFARHVEFRLIDMGEFTQQVELRLIDTVGFL